MSWLVVFLLIGFWVMGLLNGYSFGGLIHILLVYAGLIVISRLAIFPRQGTQVNPSLRERTT